MNSTKKSILLHDLNKALVYNQNNDLHLYVKLLDIRDKIKGLDSRLTDLIRLTIDLYESTDEAKIYIKHRLIEARDIIKTL